MRILVLGGTQFVGRHLVEELIRRGHAVSTFNRGQSSDELPSQVERLHGDRDEGTEGLAALAGRAWDVCVDVSGYTPRQVRPSAERLRRSVRRYVFVSAVSVYGDPHGGPVDETQPRLPPADEDVTEITAETYGPLKVTCEDIVQDIFANRCTLLRPQVVAGRYDPLDRFSYWVRRAMQEGEMLAPGDGSDFVQVIDARDVARFTQSVCEESLQGSFNLSGPRVTWADFLAILGAGNAVWVPKEILAAGDVTEFELPLYRPAGGPRSSLMHVSHERATAAGLSLTDLADTVRDVRGWLREREPSGHAFPPALSSEREADLIRMHRAVAR